MNAIQLPPPSHAVFFTGKASGKCLFNITERRSSQPTRFTPRTNSIIGKLNKQVAFDLGITEKTIKVHRASVMEKMGAQSLADLVRMAEKLHIHPSIVCPPIGPKSNIFPVLILLESRMDL